MPANAAPMLPRYSMPDGSRVVATAKLGKGSFGTAFQVRVTDLKGREQSLCLKVVKFDHRSDEERALAIDEVKAMLAVKHENIVSLISHWFSDAGRLCILMELCEGGSLHQLIQKHKAKAKRLTALKVTHYMQELAGALAYIHDDLKMIHRDLKPENILLDEFGNLKITDFGLAKSNANELFHTSCGTTLFMAPEQISVLGDGYSFKADVWALGCVLYELMALRSPWLDGTEPRNIAVQLVKQRIRRSSVDWTVVQAYPTKLIDVVGWTLDPDPTSRACASQLVQLLEMGERPSRGADKGLYDVREQSSSEAETVVTTEAIDLVVGDKADVGELAAEEAVHAAVQKIQTSFRRSFARRDRREQREARRRVDGSAVPVAWGGGEEELEKKPLPEPDGDTYQMAVRALQQAKEVHRALDLERQRTVKKYASPRKYQDGPRPTARDEDPKRLHEAAELIQLQMRNSFERARRDTSKLAGGVPAVVKADARLQRLRELAKPRQRHRMPPPPPPPPPYFPRNALPAPVRNWRGAW